MIEVKILQPEIGYRFSADAVTLGKYINHDLCRSSYKILDVGIGVGAISLYAVYQRDNDHISGVDIDCKALQLCEANLKNNNHHKFDLVCDDIKNAPYRNQLFDIVITNPPFYKSGSGRVSPYKAFANHETLSLEAWLEFCIKRLRQKGVLYMVHLPERLPEIIMILSRSCGAIEIIPIIDPGRSRAKRVIVKCKKDSKTPLAICAPIPFL